MDHSERTYFTHQIRGNVYGAWYRRISPVELEVIGAGFIERAAYGGHDAQCVARSILESVVLDAEGHANLNYVSPLDGAPSTRAASR